MTNGTEGSTGWLPRVGWLLRHWFDEPIGLAVPLVALVIVLLAPQMPDIFAGIEFAGIKGWVRSLFFAISVMFLGFSAWYWTRAALMARYGVSDAERHKELETPRHEKEPDAQSRRCSPAEKGSLEWAPRIALVVSGIITLAPLLIAFGGERGWKDVPFLAVILGFGLIIVSFWLVHKRHKSDWHSHRKPPEWMWRWRPTAVIAAAPFGWHVAVVLLILSGIGVLILATHHALFGYIFPNWPSSWPAGPDYAFYTPTAALFTLGLVIPPLVMALALLRDAVHLLLPLTMIVGLNVLILLLKVVWRLLPPPVLSLLWQIWERVRLLGGQQRSTGDQQQSPEDIEALFDKIRSVKISNKISSNVGLVLLFIWIFVFPLTGEPEKVYEVRTVSTTKLDEPSGACDTGDGATLAHYELCRPRIEDAIMRWHDAKVASGHPKGRPMPVIIAAAEGGGSRAAAWMLSAMELLDSKTNGDFGRYLFAISGVSGGSLGAVTYLQALRQYSVPDGGGLNWTAGETCKGVQALAEGDLLTASIATYVLNDTLGHLFGVLWRDVDDRSIALEKTFERYWQSEAGLKIPAKQAKGGFVALRADGDPGLPHLLLNGTDKDTGRRVITSTIRFHDDDLFAASDDLLAILKKDVYASTAVTNSARFPYISPPGRFKEVLDDNSPPKDREVLDGGYFENYGVRTAAELSRKIKKISDEKKLKLEPIVIVISNDANAPRSNEDEKKMVKEEGLITCPNVRNDGDPSKPTSKENSTQTPQALEERGRGIAGNLLAPLLGLYATRGAHSQDALHILRRDHCFAKEPRDDRMIHIALPNPEPSEGEAVPLNWVLNEDAAKFLIDIAPDISFNQKEAQKLNTILQALLPPPGGSEPGARQGAQAQQEQ